jgi:hypothetical protein
LGTAAGVRGMSRMFCGFKSRCITFMFRMATRAEAVPPAPTHRERVRQRARAVIQTDRLSRHAQKTSRVQGTRRHTQEERPDTHYMHIHMHKRTSMLRPGPYRAARPCFGRRPLGCDPCAWRCSCPGHPHCNTLSRYKQQLRPTALTQKESMRDNVRARVYKCVCVCVCVDRGIGAQIQ